MQTLGHQRPSCQQPGVSTSFVAASTIVDATLILTLADSADGNGAATLGAIALDRIPRFQPFVAGLQALNASHNPVSVRYAPKSFCFLATHAECRLRDTSHLPVLQLLLNVSDISNMKLELPLFGPEPLRALSTFALTSMSLKGELPCIYQFLCALYAPALGRLDICFHRNPYDRLSAHDDPMRDHAYLLVLLPHSFPALRKVTLVEEEDYPRHTEVSLGCALRPLMYIPMLEDVELRLTASPMWVSDGDLMQIAKAWPGANRLVFTCVKSCNYATRVEDLAYIARGCPELTELVLPHLQLDCPEHDLSVGMSSNGIAASSGVTDTSNGLLAIQNNIHHPLRHFRVSCQTSMTISLERAREIAQLIDKYFPNLELDPQFAIPTDNRVFMRDWYVIWTFILQAQIARNPLQ